MKNNSCRSIIIISLTAKEKQFFVTNNNVKFLFIKTQMIISVIMLRCCTRMCECKAIFVLNHFIGLLACITNYYVVLPKIYVEHQIIESYSPYKGISLYLYQ